MSDRDAYVQKMKAKLDEWNAELAKLEARAQGAQADSKIEYEKQIGELKQKRDEARTELTKMSESSETAWQDLRAGFDRAWSSLESAMKSAASRFK